MPKRDSYKKRVGLGNRPSDYKEKAHSAAKFRIGKGSTTIQNCMTHTRVG